MQQSSPDNKRVYAIQKARNGGYTCVVGPDAEGIEIDCSVSSLHELFAWMAREAGMHYQDMPYAPQQPVMQLQRPSEPMPRPPEMVPRSPPPPLPHAPDPEPPLPHGIVPDHGPSGLMHALEQRMGGRSALSCIPLLGCLLLAHGWPFGV